ncbi:MAG TPA: hypothetical protein VN894_18350 [Polyangiaceae bacterium]|nr:hypothetical protein [Polyangiaceae bacterium]
MSANERIDDGVLAARERLPAPSTPEARSKRGPASMSAAAARAALEGPAVRAGNLARAMIGRIRRRPIASLAVAAGLGFVIGGALSFRGGRIALGAAARHVAREVLKQVL